jgi:hypothetical protein
VIISAFANVDFGPFYHGFQAGPIVVIDNSDRGDVYRVALSNPQTIASAAIELIDAESQAVSSDALMTDISLANYMGEFDVATITIQVGPPGSYWRVVGTINRFDRNVVYCPCDWNHSDNVDSQDFFDFITDFFSGGGDFNGDGSANTQDLFDFLKCFFSHPDCQ